MPRSATVLGVFAYLLAAALAFANGAYGVTSLDALHAAVRAGDLGAVRRLLAAGAEVNARDASGSTPLMSAARVGKLRILRVFFWPMEPT